MYAATQAQHGLSIGWWIYPNTNKHSSPVPQLLLLYQHKHLIWSLSIWIHTINTELKQYQAKSYINFVNLYTCVCHLTIILDKEFIYTVKFKGCRHNEYIKKVSVH